jgi:hypothetical protein
VENTAETVRGVVVVVVVYEVVELVVTVEVWGCVV